MDLALQQAYAAYDANQWVFQQYMITQSQG
jgi:hypothetical protein